MSEDFENEVAAINSIYGDGSLTAATELEVYIVHLPQHAAALRVYFPNDYPSSPPAVLGSHSSGQCVRKGQAAHVAQVFREVLGKLYQPGEVCMFDVIEEVNTILSEGAEDVSERQAREEGDNQDVTTAIVPSTNTNLEEFPSWTISEAVIELKSVFVARVAPVSSPNQAKQNLQQLLDSDKRIRSAAHNITAWRIRGDNDVSFQDCDDDGETAAGGRLLHLMQLMGLWNVMVVVTRWYGGHHLGPRRFAIINTVARDAFVKGNFVEETSAKKKGKH